MKNLFSLLAIILVYSITILAQVSVNTDGSPADSSAMLDVKSSNRGFLPPRVALDSLNDTLTISRPATGLLIYNTSVAGTSPNDVTTGYYYFDSTSWVLVARKFEIGQTYQGGIIFYLDASGQHGLIAAPADLGYTIQWTNGFYIITDAVRDSLYGGKANTERIIIKQGAAGGAAALCADYHGGGFGDWYLPSKYELDLMYHNLKLDGIGGFSDEFYWSSSEESDTNAWLQYFLNGNQYAFDKTNYLSVRAVRTF